MLTGKRKLALQHSKAVHSPLRAADMDVSAAHCVSTSSNSLIQLCSYNATCGRSPNPWRYSAVKMKIMKIQKYFISFLFFFLFLVSVPPNEMNKGECCKRNSKMSEAVFTHTMHTHSHALACSESPKPQSILIKLSSASAVVPAYSVLESNGH